MTADSNHSAIEERTDFSSRSSETASFDPAAFNPHDTVSAANDYSLSAAPGEGGVALLEEANRPRCEHCGAVGRDTGQAWCRKCGYYPSLGICVELEEYDRVDEEDEAPEQQQETEPDKPWIAFFKALPRWSWFLLGGFISAFVLGVVGRLVTPADSLARSIWGLAQFGVGGAAFFAAHCYAYFLASVDDTSAGMLDILIRPISIWTNRFRELPETLWHVMTAATGLSAAFFALLLVGIPLGFLTDWGIREKADVNLMQAITNTAKNATGKTDNAEEDLAMAVKNLAGDEEEQEAKLPKPPKEIWESIDCVIVGYVPLQEQDAGGMVRDREDDFRYLIVASLVKGKLRVVARVRDGFSPQLREQLMEGMNRIRRERPFVVCKDQGVWVAPQLTCRILYKEWTPKDELKNPKIDKLLAEL